MPRGIHRISTALRLRREEYDAVLKNLEKIKRRTKHTHQIDCTEKFIKAQGWAKNMEAVYNDLVHLRNGIENIVSNWDVVQFVAAKFEEVVTVDVTKKEESRRSEHRWEREVIGTGSLNYVDRIQLTMVKLTKANKEALNRYTNLDELPLPDALYHAGDLVIDTDETCAIQLVQCSAELLNPLANSWMGNAYKYGYIMKKDINSALSHFKAASSRGETLSTMELMAYYQDENDRQNVSKYVKTFRRMAPDWADQILGWINPVEHSSGNGEVEQHLIRESRSMCALDQSYLHFCGLCVRKSNQNAIKALPTVDSGSYSIQFDPENTASFGICFRTRPHHHSWYYPRHFVRKYLDFLFESNQFLPFFIWAYEIDINPRT